MSFKFNFEVNGESESNSKPTKEQGGGSAAQKVDSEKVLVNAKLHKIKHLKKEWAKSTDVLYTIESVDINNDFKMYFIEPHVGNQTESNGEKMLNAEVVTSDSDLIPGIYEGGLKVWECSIDLVNFLTAGKLEKCNVENARVLELGCGIGLPGICAGNLGAEAVCFQDFNDFVITNATAPSLLLNEKIKNKSGVTEQEVITDINVDDLLFAEKTELDETKFTFVSGDWRSIGKILIEKFDIILSAETIYCVDYYERLHAVLQQSLSDKGSIFIAAKSFYFGVGGGVHLWEEFVKSKGVFCAEVVETVNASLPRKIVKMMFKR